MTSAQVCTPNRSIMWPSFQKVFIALKLEIKFSLPLTLLQRRKHQIPAMSPLPLLLIFFSRWVLSLAVSLGWGHSSVHAEADVKFMWKAQHRTKISESFLSMLIKYPVLRICMHLVLVFLLFHCLLYFNWNRHVQTIILLDVHSVIYIL